MFISEEGGAHSHHLFTVKTQVSVECCEQLKMGNATFSHVWYLVTFSVIQIYRLHLPVFTPDPTLQC